MSENVIGPVVAEPQPSSSTIQGERHVSDVAGRGGRSVGRNAGVGMIAAGAAIAVGFIFLGSAKPSLKLDTATAGPRSLVHYEPPPLPAPATVTPPLPADQVPPLPPGAVPLQPATNRSVAQTATPHAPAKLLIYSASGAGAGQAGNTYGAIPAGYQPGGQGSEGAAREAGQGGEEGLAARLQTTKLSGVQADVLRNQPYLLTTGTLVPCVLQSAMDSTLPGFVTCVIPSDVVGKTGLTLLDRGTKVVGQFQGGIRQGVERMFVTWTRAETPQGVVIDLGSPASDPLGRAGLGGTVYRHFWQRFGGALLLSVVDGAIQTGTAAASKGGTTTVNTGAASGTITETLRGSINLAPTVRKNQGELVSIFVARDLDFSTVYRVGPTPQRYLSAASRP